MFNRYGLMVLPVVDAERVPFAPVVLKLRDQSGLICIIKSFSADFFKILDPDGKFYNRSHTMGLLFSINKILCLFMVCLLFLSFCAGRFCSLQISESIIIYAWQIISRIRRDTGHMWCKDHFPVTYRGRRPAKTLQLENGYDNLETGCRWKRLYREKITGKGSCITKAYENIDHRR